MIVPDEILMSKIYFIRGQKVILDSDLAELYQVETKALKQAVKRNEDIFPLHFMFELTVEEFEVLRSQNVTSKNGRGGTRYLPYVFTEYGILQAANILRSARAKQMSIRIIEVFVRLQKMIIDNLEIRSLIEKLDKKTENNAKNIEIVFKYFDELLEKNSEDNERTPIGFKITRSRK